MLLPLVFLSSCGAPKSVSIADYFDDAIGFKEGFKLLQLTDLHWSVNTDVSAQGAYLSQVVKVADPDFIMVSGDLLLGATSTTAESLVKVMESWGKPFGVTWGNHDREGEYSPTWLSNLFKNAKNSHYHEINDDVFGRSNYVISLKDATGKAAWNIYSIDSNSYPESKNGIYYDYDVIHDDQIAWFEKAAAYSTSLNGRVVPGMAFFHIPLWQWCYGYLDDPKGKIGEVLENSSFSTGPSEILKLYQEKGLPLKSWIGYKDTGFYSKGVTNGVKGFFCGHDHSNDWGTEYQDSQGLKAYIGYGVKSGKELYYTHGKNRDFDIIGGSLTTLYGNGTFDLKHYYVQSDANYTVFTEEVKGL